VPKNGLLRNAAEVVLVFENSFGAIATGGNDVITGGIGSNEKNEPNKTH